jgi:hypothetical protein
MVELTEGGRDAGWLRWLVVILALCLTVVLPLASADSESAAFGLPLDVVLTTLATPAALVLLSLWYAGRADKSSRRRREA